MAAARVIDGDTVGATITFTFPLRFAAIDTPELRNSEQKAAALVAKAYLQKWLDDAEKNNQPVAVLLYGIGMWERLDGDLLNRTTGQKASMYLLEQGVAVPSSGKRHAWTAEELRRIETTEGTGDRQELRSQADSQLLTPNSQK